MRAWIPNQKRSSFHWIFQEAIISLLPMDIFKRTRFILADGDPQQANEIIGAIESYAVNARRGSCAWHIVHMGWKRNARNESCLPTNPATMRQKFSVMKQIICAWIYSWMCPGYCETEEEYNVSKTLLFAFLQSKVVYNVCDKKRDLVQRIMDFI